MKYSDKIPEKLFDDNPSLENFIKVLDGVEEYKKLEIEKAVLFNKSPLLTNLNWLRKKALALGHTDLPENLVKEQLDALILNSNDIMATKGSFQGLYLWLWALTFGNITINSVQFFPLPNYIQPGDVDYGYISNIAPINQTLYLFSGYQNFGSSTLTVSIGTKYHNQPNLLTFIENHIKDHIGFLDTNAVINITLTAGVYNTSPEPYPYFVT